MAPKLFITGERNAGKSWVVHQVLAQTSPSAVGFRSYKQDTAPGEATVWLEDIQNPSLRWPLAQIAQNKPKQIFPQVFEQQGVNLLKGITAETKSLVIMDEIGFMESNAPLFQQEILRILSLPLPVLGVLRQDSTPFLDQLFAHPALTVLPLTRATQPEVLAFCLDKLK